MNPKLDNQVTGRCLCGACEVTIDQPKSFGVCHCAMCRKWTGGVFMSVSGGKGFNFEGNHNIKRYASSAWAERGFCGVCGTNLFYRMKQSDHYFFMLGLFDRDCAPKFEEQQYIDEKPVVYSFAEKTKLVRGTEMEAMLDEFLKKHSHQTDPSK